MSKDKPETTPAADEAPAEPTPVVFIIGAGVVGTTLAAKLARVGVPVAGVHGRDSELSDAASAVSGVLGSTGNIPNIISESDVVIVAVRDTRVPEVAKRLVDEKRLRPEQVLLHTSGNRPAAEMLAAAKGKVRGLGTLHPLIAVTDAPGTLENLADAYFGVEGDATATRAAEKLVALMGGHTLRLARSLLVAAGVPQRDALPALLPLMTSAVRNLVEVGLPSAMTGPVVRGDVASVERHIAALEARAPEQLDLYRRLGREVLRVAQQAVPDQDAGALDRLTAIFGPPDQERGEKGSSKPVPAKKKR
jgi:predicted short-subunit dehydrogenase-like oxidoreductase (DUF2520 family)